MSNRILLVDDNPVNLHLLEKILIPLGYSTVSALNGLDALAILERETVDLVLLDLMMPGIDGYEVLRRIRARENKRWLPVIIVTAENAREARQGGFDAGADEYLEKPIDRPLLLTRVRTLLKLHETQEILGERTRALEEANVARREVVNLIVHDLKNPLTVVHANLNYLESTAVPGSPDFSEALHDATVATRRIMGLVVDILSVERMDLSEMPILRAEFNMASLVAEVCRSHRREIAMQKLQLSEMLTNARVSADSNLVRRAVENLVENAIRHTSANGNIDIAVESGREVAVVVSNTGQPIPDEVRETMFQKYVKGAGAAYRFGLGLYFCQRVATAYGGTVALVERSGWPVSFRLALPAV